MKLIKITEKIVNVTDPTFGNKTLYQGKTYLTYNAMAEKLIQANWAKIAGDRKALSLLPREVLRQNNKTFKVLLLFSGGFGDAISLAILLNLLAKEYNLRIDVGCHYDTWYYILLPMGFRGKRLDCPVELERLNEYDYIQPNVADFILDQTGKKEKSVPEELAKAYRIDISRFYGHYHVPENIEKRMGLVNSSSVRIGVNFESNGMTRNYPDELGEKLIRELVRLRFEVYRFGIQQLKNPWHIPENTFHDYSGRTDIPELAALLKQMDIVVSMDSLTAHLSNILGVRTIVLLSTSAPGVYKWHNNVVCIPSKINCSSCGAINDRCPKGYNECKAFYHRSVRPESIGAKIVQECIYLFKNQLPTDKIDTSRDYHEYRQ